MARSILRRCQMARTPQWSREENGATRWPPAFAGIVPLLFARRDLHLLRRAVSGVVGRRH